MAHVFVDVSNVASIRKGGAGYAPWKDAILVCEAWLARHPADNLTLIVDWGFHGYLQHNFPDQFRSYVRARDAKKVRFPNAGKSAALIETPSDVAADEFILRRADRYTDRVVIAEDHYRPYRDKYGWLQGFSLQLPVIEGNQVHFEELFLSALSDGAVEDAQDADEEKRAELELRRDSRRNRHQRRLAARSASVKRVERPREAVFVAGEARSRASAQREPNRAEQRVSSVSRKRLSSGYWALWTLLVVLSLAAMALLYVVR